MLTVAIAPHSMTRPPATTRTLSEQGPVILTDPDPEACRRGRGVEEPAFALSCRAPGIPASQRTSTAFAGNFPAKAHNRRRKEKRPESPRLFMRLRSHAGSDRAQPNGKSGRLGPLPSSDKPRDCIRDTANDPPLTCTDPCAILRKSPGTIRRTTPSCSAGANHRTQQAGETAAKRRG